MSKASRRLEAHLPSQRRSDAEKSLASSPLRLRVSAGEDRSHPSYRPNVSPEISTRREADLPPQRRSDAEKTLKSSPLRLCVSAGEDRSEPSYRPRLSP